HPYPEYLLDQRGACYFQSSPRKTSLSSRHGKRYRCSPCPPHSFLRLLSAKSSQTESLRKLCSGKLLGLSHQHVPHSHGETAREASFPPRHRAGNPRLHPPLCRSSSGLRY